MTEGLRERLLVKPGARPQLASIDPRETFGRERASAEGDLKALRTRLEELQDRLWAGDGGALLVVLQGIDTSGKDGTLRHVCLLYTSPSPRDS